MSPYQHQILERKNGCSLECLDLAALLKVMDKNWMDLAVMEELTSQDRNFLKEMMAVRNRWAHEAVSAITDEDTYRDIDTLERFLRVIGVPHDLSLAIQNAKQTVITRMAGGMNNRRIGNLQKGEIAAEAFPCPLRLVNKLWANNV